MKFLFLLIFFVTTVPLWGQGRGLGLKTLRLVHPAAVVEVPVPTTALNKLHDNSYLQQVWLDLESLSTAANPLLRQVQLLRLTRMRQHEHGALLVSYLEAEEQGREQAWQQRFDRFGSEKIFPWLKSGFVSLSAAEFSRVVQGYPHTMRELQYRYRGLMKLKTDFYDEAIQIYTEVMHEMLRSTELMELYGRDAKLQLGLSDDASYWQVFRYKLDREAKTFPSTKEELLASWQRWNIKARLRKLRQARPQDAREMLFLTNLAQATVDEHEAGMLVAMYRAAVLEQEELLYPNQQKATAGFSVAQLWKDLYILQRKHGKTLAEYVLNSDVSR